MKQLAKKQLSVLGEGQNAAWLENKSITAEDALSGQIQLLSHFSFSDATDFPFETLTSVLHDRMSWTFLLFVLTTSFGISASLASIPTINSDVAPTSDCIAASDGAPPDDCASKSDQAPNQINSQIVATFDLY